MNFYITISIIFMIVGLLSFAMSMYYFKKENDKKFTISILTSIVSMIIAIMLTRMYREILFWNFIK